MSVYPYAALLDAIGFYVERANGADVLVNEIEGGLLVAFLTATDQQVVTLDDAELAQLRAEIAALEPPREDQRPPQRAPEKPRLGIRLRGLLGHADAVSSGPARVDPLEPTNQPGLRASDGAVLVKKQLPAGRGAQGAQIYAGSPVVVDRTLIVTSSFAGRVLAFSIPQLLQHG